MAAKGWEDYLEEGHLEKILTFGGILAAAIGTSYIIKAYLDILRIKALKRELKNPNTVTPIIEEKGDKNWVMEDTE
mgnify:CR=1 FL=1|jgi:hypothetical protein|tara:strand:+ start:313 stop:540 length:228 start_codon:yes stop_codon:yes gene_type:complete